jgi:hypothetical protein
MKHNKIKLSLYVAALFVAMPASAALYNILGTDYYVNALPSNLNTKERAKLVSTNADKTDAAVAAKKYIQVTRADAKTKVKAIVLAENPPKSCPAGTEGTPPMCNAPVPKTCAPLIGTYPDCKQPPVVEPPPPQPDPDPIKQVGDMPAVDTRLNMIASGGYSDLRIQSTSESAPTKTDGAFRIVCAPSHMSNDDPMVYPNQEGATHHHTFYGNTSVNYKSNLATLSTTGNSTCNGGTMNRSAYWHPTMIDTTTKAPVLPDGGAIFYYKTGYGISPSSIKAPPKGLRMLVGNPKATTSDQVQAAKYVCINIARADSNGMPWQKAIPNCGTDSYLQMVVVFPQCWDGKNLDSPNHKDHMAYAISSKCPATHPVIIPEISLNMNYKIKANGVTAKWRLASDNYPAFGFNAGYSGHADWVNGWDETTLNGIVKNCLNASKDCHAHLLGDGRMFY